MAPSLPEAPELQRLDALLAAAARVGEVRTLCRAPVRSTRRGGPPASLPVHAILLGNPDPAVPALGLVGGVHGLERIGAQAVLTHLEQLLARWPRDEALRDSLQRLRLVVVPVLNPVGLACGTRCNGRGVDLMRNAPVQADEGASWLVGGQRFSRALPWFRGGTDGAMEPEAEGLCRLVREELMPHRVSVVVDCHSGFGLRDRVWFPHARSAAPVTHLPEFHALGLRVAPAAAPGARARALREFEPQSRQYRTHGDLWDHLYDEACARGDGLLLPLTLEIGSWRWVRRHPAQLLSRWGLFHPMQPARAAREARRQARWLARVADQVMHVDEWLPRGEARALHRRAALARWYGGPSPFAEHPTAAPRPALPVPAAAAAPGRPATMRA